MEFIEAKVTVNSENWILIYSVTKKIIHLFSQNWCISLCKDSSFFKLFLFQI